MFGLNPWELGIILLVVLLLFGAKRVPEIGRALGKGIREFKSGVEAKDDTSEPAKTDAKEEEKTAP
jgi:sec-independent protein translocase protein TatA